ncbi:hypothetical protein [uncultured Marinobacter sp.]|uniref:hypothetical protein n=1 Tax=uncultured Marinobacter sp. TaxID=187379 RepID=UPI0030DCE55A
MNVDKAKKRIAKQVNKGFHGYPLITLEYFGKTPETATDLVISFTLDENAEPQKQRFVSESDVREDEMIQSTLVRIIERAEAKTVAQVEGVSILAQSS